MLVTAVRPNWRKGVTQAKWLFGLLQAHRIFATFGPTRRWGRGKSERARKEKEKKMGASVETSAMRKKITKD